MRDPVDTLRRAADVLDQAAGKATPGPWRLGDQPGGNEIWANRDPAGWDAFMVATAATRLNPNPGVRGYSDAAYIALVGPTVGKKLAALLRSEAEAYNDTGIPIDVVEKALAVARALLREADDDT